MDMGINQIVRVIRAVSRLVGKQRETKTGRAKAHQSTPRRRKLSFQMMSIHIGPIANRVEGGETKVVLNCSADCIVSRFG